MSEYLDSFQQRERAALVNQIALVALMLLSDRVRGVAGFNHAATRQPESLRAFADYFREQMPKAPPAGVTQRKVVAALEALIAEIDEETARRAP
jgi:hypothetical protein